MPVWIMVVTPELLLHLWRSANHCVVWIWVVKPLRWTQQEIIVNFGAVFQQWLVELPIIIATSEKRVILFFNDITLSLALFILSTDSDFSFFAVNLVFLFFPCCFLIHICSACLLIFEEINMSSIKSSLSLFKLIFFEVVFQFLLVDLYLFFFCCLRIGLFL